MSASGRASAPSCGPSGRRSAWRTTGGCGRDARWPGRDRVRVLPAAARAAAAEGRGLIDSPQTGRQARMRRFAAAQ